MAKNKRQKVKHYNRSFYSRETRVKRGMKLFLQFLHEKCLLSFFHGMLFDYTSFCGTAQPFCP